jgi:hypothetical protein
MNGYDLVTRASAAHKGTDADLARTLCITRQTLHQMKTGKCPIPDRLAKQLSQIAGLNPAQTIAELHADRADPETREI